MSTVTWLHISDLHLRLPRTPEPGRDPLPYDVNVVLGSFLDDLTERIEQDGLRPDFIAVTGDVAFSGKEEEYALARRFFDDLLERTGLGKERLFLVPGNHDADWDRISWGARAMAASLTDRDSINKVLAELESRDLLFARFGGYADFVRGYLGDETLPEEHCTTVRTLEVAGKEVALLGLNSAWLAQGGEADYGALALGERLVRSALDRAVSADLVIALLHHPFAWLKEFEQGDSQALLCRECDFILHGHLHQTGLTFQRDPDAEATVIGTGALYKTREHPNGYNLVQLDFGTYRGTCVFRAWSDRRGGFWTADTQTYRNVENGVYAFPYGAPPPPTPELPLLHLAPRAAYILVVEDQPSICEDLELILELEEYYVLTAHDGVEALGILQSQPVDLILADISMPRMNGYQLYTRVRENSQWAGIPFIFLTARALDSDIRYGKELGVDDYLTKPIQPEDLLAAVEGKIRRAEQLAPLLRPFPPPSMSGTQILSFGRLRIEPDQNRVWVDRKLVKLSAREFILLEYLAHRINQVVSFQELIQAIYELDTDQVEADALLRPLIRSLRCKLGGGGGEMGCIESVREAGYRLIVPDGS